MSIHGPSNSAERVDTFRSYQRKKDIVEYRSRTASSRPARPKAACLSQTFRGVMVYFQGFQEGYSDYHLKRLVEEHGGIVRSHLAIKKTTHVICSNLSCSKLQDMIDRISSKKGTLQVVTPQWVVDSIAAKRLVPETRYSIIPSSEKVTQFFRAKIPHSNVPLGKRRISDQDNITSGQPDQKIQKKIEWSTKDSSKKKEKNYSTPPPSAPIHPREDSSDSTPATQIKIPSSAPVSRAKGESFRLAEDLTSHLYHSQYSMALSQVPNAQEIQFRKQQ